VRNRTVRSFSAAVTLAFFGAVTFTHAATPQLTVKKVKDNVYVAGGIIANSTIIIGRDGVIVVDAQNRPDEGRQVVLEVGKLTPKPLTTVILTHSDPDHARGLGGFPHGLTIIATENAKKEIEAELARGGERAPPRDYLPNKIVQEPREDVTIDGVKMTLIHIAPAHTSGDLAVYLPDEKLVVGGDLLGDGDPTVHLEKNGSSEGWIRFVSALVALDADTYIRGHVDVATRDQVRASLAHTQTKRAKIVELVKEGKSLDEIKQAVGDPLKNPSRFPSFTETTYQELTRK
jgi:cyclase